MSSIKTYSSAKIFTGDKWLTDHCIITENGMIQDLRPLAELPPGNECRHFSHCIIAPAFMDLQIYGAYGKLFAVSPSVASLLLLEEYCVKGGAAFCLATVATNTKEVCFACMDALRDYWKEGGKTVMGLHLEGPWINPLRRGAHIEALIHPPAVEEVKEYLDYGKGCIKMITLAPEQCDPAIVQLFRSYGIVVAAGHSNATWAEAKQGFASGITAVTHLFNAMSPLQHRAPGLAGAAMDDETVMASIIPDGHHVDFAAVRIAKKAMRERLFVITDAVTATDTGYYQHRFSGDKYEAGGILSGSSLMMSTAMRNLVTHNVTDLTEALRMCSLYPARVLQLEQAHGIIAPGKPANMVVLDENLEVVQLLQ